MKLDERQSEDEREFAKVMESKDFLRNLVREVDRFTEKILDKLDEIEDNRA